MYIFNRAAAKDVSGRRDNHQCKSASEVIRIEGGMPAIVSEAVFNGVANILKSRRQMSGNGQAKEPYLLTGKIVCGECGKSFGGARKFCGRSKHKYVTYRCYNRDRTGDTACHNSEIQRDLLEGFVLKQIANIVFDDNNASIWLERYKEYQKEHGDRADTKLAELQEEAEQIQVKIGNIAKAIAEGESASRSLVDMIRELEERKDEIDRQIEEEVQLLSVPDVTEDDIRDSFAKARALMRSGELPELRQLVNLYLEQVVVYKERVEVVLRTMPAVGRMKDCVEFER